MLQQYQASRLFVAVWFEDWASITGGGPPPVELAYLTALYHWSRAMAYAASAQLENADSALAALLQTTKENEQEMATQQISTGTSTAQLTSIAIAMAEAEVAWARRDTKRAMASLERAVQQQAALGYNEPPDWPIPVSVLLGRRLLQEAQRVGDSEGRSLAHRAHALFDESVRKSRENWAWPVYGAVEALALLQEEPEREQQLRRISSQLHHSADLDMSQWYA